MLSVLLQADENTKWKVGDMLWAKISGHPWWPCIVAPNPTNSVYTKLLPSR